MVVQQVDNMQAYWGDDVTIYQLVITTLFHFSLLSLIARHITIVTPESTIQSYQYITTVTLFTRTQSSTLGPRCVISCSDLFTYLPSLRYSVLGDLSIIIISSLSQRSLLPLLLGYGPHKRIRSGIILRDSPFPKAQWYQLLCLVWQHEGSLASSSPMALCGRIRRLPPYTPYNSPSWLWRQTLCYHLCSI